MHVGTSRVVAALFLLSISACGSGPQSIPLGTYESSISGTRTEIDGAWALTIEPQGRFRIALNGQPAVTGSYAYDGAEIVFTDESGPMMCAAGVTTGSYLWKLDRGGLELLVVSDECPARRGILARQRHKRTAGT